jgi:hypothetical protein
MHACISRLYCLSFSFADFELADRRKLTILYPKYKTIIDVSRDRSKFIIEESFSHIRYIHAEHVANTDDYYLKISR